MISTQVASVPYYNFWNLNIIQYTSFPSKDTYILKEENDIKKNSTIRLVKVRILFSEDLVCFYLGLQNLQKLMKQ